MSGLWNNFFKFVLKVIHYRRATSAFTNVLASNPGFEWLLELRWGFCRLHPYCFVLFDIDAVCRAWFDISRNSYLLDRGRTAWYAKCVISADTEFVCISRTRKWWYGCHLPERRREAACWNKNHNTHYSKWRSRCLIVQRTGGWSVQYAASVWNVLGKVR